MVSRLPDGFESPRSANGERVRLVSQLKDYASTDAMALAARLESCSRDVRCAAAACPVCLRRPRVNPLCEVPPHFADHRLVRVSYEPSDCRVSTASVKWSSARFGRLSA